MFSLYFGAMKKITLTLALALSLVACSKQVDRPEAVTATKTETFFSRVQYFKDGRKPATDTVWTLRLLSSDMVTTYQKQVGYVYAETSTYREVGVLWSK